MIFALVGRPPLSFFPCHSPKRVDLRPTGNFPLRVRCAPLHLKHRTAAGKKHGGMIKGERDRELAHTCNSAAPSFPVVHSSFPPSVVVDYPGVRGDSLGFWFPLPVSSPSLAPPPSLLYTTPDWFPALPSTPESSAVAVAMRMNANRGEERRGEERQGAATSRCFPMKNRGRG